MDDSRGIGLFKKRSFRTRLITGIVLAVLLALTFILGYTVMLCVLGLLSVGGVWEFLNAKKIIFTPFAVTALVADIFYYILIYFYDRPYITLYMIFLFVLFAITDIVIFLLKYPKYNLNDLFASYFSVFYIGITLSFLYLTRVHPWGAYLVWLSIFSSWGCDVFAYLGGMLYGKRRIFPDISPKKTLEGCVTGVIGAGFLAFIYALCVQDYIKDIKGEAIIFPLVCIAGAVIGMFGDLFASAIKRSEGIKDYSRLLPGHGGILDRFDSVIVVSPVIYLITILIRLIN